MISDGDCLIDLVGIGEGGTIMKINKSFQSRLDNGWLHIGGMEMMADWL